MIINAQSQKKKEKKDCGIPTIDASLFKIKRRFFVSSNYRKYSVLCMQKAERECLRHTFYVKMAALVISVLGVIILFPVGSQMTDTRVEVTAPIHPVTLGGIIAFQCQIWIYKMTIW